MQTEKEILKEYKEKYKYIWDLELSADGKGYSFKAEKENWKRIVVNNWVESEEYDNILDFQYSPDWKNLAFIAKKENWKYVIVNNLVESPEY